MKPISIQKYYSVQDAVKAISESSGKTSVYSGGSDILVRLKNRLYTAPDMLVDIKGIKELHFVRFDTDKGLDIGSQVTLGELLESNALQEYPILAETISQISSPELRNQSTIGGNLLQEVWCPYYRSNYRCWRNGGETCYAEAGDNTEYQSIMGARQSYAAYPGDMAISLTALDASVLVEGTDGEKWLTLEELIPGEVQMKGKIQSHVLKPDEILKEIHIPPPATDTIVVYRKVRKREVWDFASASLALCLTVNNGEIASAKAVFGGIATRPWRDSHLESFLQGKPLGNNLPDQAMQQALLDAKPLPHNGYKKDQAVGILYSVLEEIVKEQS